MPGGRRRVALFRGGRRGRCSISVQARRRGGGFGSGNMPPGAVPAVRRWLDDGKPVVLATRCPRGQVTPVYAFDGGGARTVAMGAIPAGPRTPSQARMELVLALSAGVAYGRR
jgi:L-asparaginase